MSYIVVEIIPTYSIKEKGIIAQIQALKLDDLTLIERFDYRVEDKYIDNDDIKRMISYDKEMFTYTTPKNLLLKFKKFIGKDKLLIIDNDYTKDYLEDFKNEKESIFNKLNMKYSNDIFNEIKKKYKLEDSNHLVDLLYEALIYESNNVNK